MTKPESQYQKLGIDPGKENVRKIFGRIVRNDFPGAFVNIVRDPEVPSQVFTMHADGDGSKFVQRLLHYFETGEETILQGAVDDAFSMNTGDVAASGFVFGRWVINQVIDINAQKVPKDRIMEQIAQRVESLLELYQSFGFNHIYFMGGETADLPDQVKSVVYNANIYAEAKEEDLVLGNTQPGDAIFGFASDGQAVWEQSPNSGIMSNGVTLARTYTMDEPYGQKYPFLIRDGGRYKGRLKVNDTPIMLGGLTVSQAILSPTRQWAILIRLLVERLKRDGIFHMLHGISMNTGGGATKITNVGRGVLYIKDMPDPPPIFHLVQAESGENWLDMYRGMNCGVGLDVVGEDNPRFWSALEKVGQETAIKLYPLGKCKNSGDGRNKVILQTPFGCFDDY